MSSSRVSSSCRSGCRLVGCRKPSLKETNSEDKGGRRCSISEPKMPGKDKHFNNDVQKQSNSSALLVIVSSSPKLRAFMFDVEEIYITMHWPVVPRAFIEPVACSSDMLWLIIKHKKQDSGGSDARGVDRGMEKGGKTNRRSEEPWERRSSPF